MPAPIAEFVPALQTKSGGPFPLAALVGPTFRVAADGDCLNVRATASRAAQSLGCYRDGVLLGDLGDVSDAEGVPWRRVRTPGGAEGWASGEFLAR